MILISTLFVFILHLNSQYLVKDAVNDALNKSNLVKSQYYKIEEARAAIDEVKYLKYGGFNISALLTKGDEPVYVFATKMRQHIFSMSDMMNINNPSSIKNLELGFNFNFPIFTGFKIENYRKISEKNLIANQKIYDEIKNGIKFQAIYNYLSALMYKEFVTLSSNVLSSCEIELELAKKLNEKGMIFGSDYYAALSINEFIKNHYYKSIISYEKELKALSTITGKQITAEVITSSLKEIDWEIKDLNFYIDQALKERNFLKAYEDFVKIKNIEKEIAQKSLLPNIGAFFTLSGNTSKLNDLKTASIYGIRMDIPIGDPAYYSKLKKSQAQLDQILEEKKYQETKLIEEITRTYNDLLSAKKSIEITKNAVITGEKSLELFKPLYRQGKQSIMEVLRAEMNLLQAKSSLIESTFKYNLLYIKLRYMSQTFDENLINEISTKLSKN